MGARASEPFWLCSKLVARAHVQSLLACMFPLEAAGLAEQVPQALQIVRSDQREIHSLSSQLICSLLIHLFKSCHLLSQKHLEVIRLKL